MKIYKMYEMADRFGGSNTGSIECTLVKYMAVDPLHPIFYIEFYCFIVDLNYLSKMLTFL
jgi:hypothetical protein